MSKCSNILASSWVASTLTGMASGLCLANVLDPDTRLKIAVALMIGALMVVIWTRPGDGEWRR